MENVSGRIPSYCTVYRGGTAEIVVKKSRFIAHIAPAATEEEAAEFISDCKKEYWDARHNCHAFCVGLDPEITRCSDDGEPAQTAGKPMLDVLLSSGLKNTVAVVTRYFGGTLLGTGGLVRAYSSAVQAALQDCVVIEKKLCVLARVQVDYSLIGRLQRLIKDSPVMLQDMEYAEKATAKLIIPAGAQESFAKNLADISGGQAKLVEGDQCYAALADSRPIIFPII